MNKQYIISNIRSLEYSIKMSEDLLATVQEFEHDKKVTSKFIEAVKAKGYWCYIIKDKFSTTFVCSCNQHDILIDDRYDIRIRENEVFEKSPLTWTKIKEKIKSHYLEKQLAIFRKRLEVFTKEQEELKKLIEHLKSNDFICFETYRTIRDLENQYQLSNKD